MKHTLYPTGKEALRLQLLSEIESLRSQNKRLFAGAVQMVIRQNRGRIQYLKSKVARLK